MTDNIIYLKQYRQKLDEQLEQLDHYTNNGTLESMLVEGQVNLTTLVGNLTEIITVQQETINDLAQHVDELRKRGTR